MPRVAGVLAGALAVGLLSWSDPAPAYAASEINCRGISSAGGTRADADRVQVPADPYAALRVSDAQQRAGRSPGAGIRVALLDSGAEQSAVQSPVVGGAGLAPLGSELYFHGTTAAGLIAGKRSLGGVGGIAPAASLVDLPVYRPGEGEDGRVEPDRVVAALDHLLRRPRRLVVVFPFEMDRDPRVATRISRLVRGGAVVVATTGDPQGSDTHGEARTYRPGEDHHAYPAAYPGVIGVSATAQPGVDDPSVAVYASTDTDVAAPTYGARTWTLHATPCVLAEVSSGFAAAVAGGTVALMWSADPAAPGEEMAARLERTASGHTGAEKSPWTGAGVIQPYEAVTHAAARGASVVEGPTPQAGLPAREADALAGVRGDALWWGLLGGGLLVLGLVLRPLLSRHRGERL